MAFFYFHHIFLPLAANKTTLSDTRQLPLLKHLHQEAERASSRHGLHISAAVAVWCVYGLCDICSNQPLCAILLQYADDVAHEDSRLKRQPPAASSRCTVANDQRILHCRFAGKGVDSGDKYTLSSVFKQAIGQFATLVLCWPCILFLTLEGDSHVIRSPMPRPYRHRRPLQR